MRFSRSARGAARACCPVTPLRYWRIGPEDRLRCARERSTSQNPVSRRSVATRRCARTSSRSSRPRRSPRASGTRRRSCIRWRQTCELGGALFFRDSRPGPKGPRKARRVRDEVLALRAQDRSIDEIAATLAAAGTPVSAQTVWSILAAEGLERLPRRAAAQRGAPAPRLEPVKARALADWPAGEQVACDHAGLLLLMPAIVELGLPELIAASGYPSSTQLSAWHSLAALLLAKCARVARVSHSDILSDDAGLGLMLGLTALPKATHLSSYSYRVRRAANEQLLAATVRRLRELGLATGEQGFNLDFHAIRHHGTDTPLEKHYVPSRSQRTRAMLTFFAHDHASQEMVYANADLTKAEQAREVLAFADYWQQVAGSDPGLLVFDSKLTTYNVLDELTARGIHWLTLRERGPKLIADLANHPDSE